MKRKKTKKINERKSKKLNAKNDETTHFGFDQLPRDMEIIIFSFVISEMVKDWKRNWNNISLVSKHWNSISWISLQRVISKSEKITIFIQACMTGRFHFISKFLTQDTTFDPSFQHNEALVYARLFGSTDIVKLLLQDARCKMEDARKKAAQDNFVIRFVIAR